MLDAIPLDGEQSDRKGQDLQRLLLARYRVVQVQSGESVGQLVVGSFRSIRSVEMLLRQKTTNFEAEKPAIADGVNVLSGDGWRHQTPPAFPLRVLYSFQPLSIGIRLPDNYSTLFTCVLPTNFKSRLRTAWIDNRSNEWTI